MITIQGETTGLRWHGYGCEVFPLDIDTDQPTSIWLQGDEADDLYDRICRICDDHIADNDTINRRIDLMLDCYL